MSVIYSGIVSPFLLIAVGGVLLTIGDIIAKMWVDAPEPRLFIVTLVLYLMAMVCLIFSFRGKNIAVASLLLVLCNIGMLALWSWLVLDESLSRKEMVGLVLGCLAILLLEWDV